MTNGKFFPKTSRVQLSPSTFRWVHQTEKRYPKSLDKISILTWKLLVTSIFFVKLAPRELTSCEISYICRCGFDNQIVQKGVLRETRVNVCLMKIIKTHCHKKLCVFITLMKKTFKSSSFCNISNFHNGFVWNPSKVQRSLFERIARFL